MRVASLLLAMCSPALLTLCSSDLGQYSRDSTHQPEALTGVTEYYRRGSNRTFAQSAAPLPGAGTKPRGWGRVSGPPTPSTRSHPWMTASRPAPARVPITHGPTFANPDGTTSTVIGNALIRSDGTRGDMIGNTVYHSNGTKSKIVGDTLINADGSQSPRVNENP